MDQGARMISRSVGDHVEDEADMPPMEISPSNRIERGYISMSGLKCRGFRNL